MFGGSSEKVLLASSELDIFRSPFPGSSWVFFSREECRQDQLHAFSASLLACFCIDDENYRDPVNSFIHAAA